MEPIWRYLQELETDEFPYNTCYLRYTVHGDNGPPDELMPDVIRAWNERYDSPQFRIATTGEFFTDFEMFQRFKIKVARRTDTTNFFIRRFIGLMIEMGFLYI